MTPKTARLIRNACAGVAGATLLFAMADADAATAQIRAEQCSDAGQWLDPRTETVLPAHEAIARLARKGIVLLGESHTAREHHLWQTHTLAGLRAHRETMAVGFEMFPRAVQTALDKWSKGELSRAEFLKAARWAEVWGYDAALYMPLFDFARQNRLPIVALNVDRKLVARVGKEGWRAVPADAREGVGDPAPAPEPYRLALAKVYAEKLKRGVGGAHGSGDEPDKDDKAKPAPDLETVLALDDFSRFVEAQLTWDRAMAEALASAKRRNPGTLVVGVLGRGHIEFGYGVPHQLADLGITDTATVLPVEAGADCEGLARGVADMVFLVDRSMVAAAGLPKPKLGVLIEPAKEGVRILQVMDDSVARAAELESGDVIGEAAGVPVRRNSALIEIIQRQAPGTWLPLGVRRGDKSLNIIAKFPAEPKGAR